MLDLCECKEERGFIWNRQRKWDDRKRTSASSSEKKNAALINTPKWHKIVWIIFTFVCMVPNQRSIDHRIYFTHCCYYLSLSVAIFTWNCTRRTIREKKKSHTKRKKRPLLLVVVCILYVYHHSIYCLNYHTHIQRIIEKKQNTKRIAWIRALKWIGGDMKMGRGGGSGGCVICVHSMLCHHYKRLPLCYTGTFFVSLCMAFYILTSYTQLTA